MHGLLLAAHSITLPLQWNPPLAFSPSIPGTRSTPNTLRLLRLASRRTYSSMAHRQHARNYRAPSQRLAGIVPRPTQRTLEVRATDRHPQPRPIRHPSPKQNGVCHSDSILRRLLHPPVSQARPPPTILLLPAKVIISRTSNHKCTACVTLPRERWTSNTTYPSHLRPQMPQYLVQLRTILLRSSTSARP